MPIESKYGWQIQRERIPEKTDIEIRAISSSSTNDCSADFSIIYINEDEVD
jgi:hypothetical protein